MAARALELLLKRIDRRLSTSIRDNKLQKGGVTHSFRVNRDKLTKHFMSKDLYDLDATSAAKAAGMVVASLDTKFRDSRVVSGGNNYYTARSYGVIDTWKNTLAKNPTFVNLLGDGSEAFSQAFHIGHGSDKTLAAVEYRTLLAYKEWQKFAKRYDIAENALDLTFVNSAAGKKLDLDDVTIKAQATTTFTTAGNIKKAFTLWVELQPKTENVGTQSQAEKSANTKFKKAIESAIEALVEREDWEETKASPSVVKHISKAIDKAVGGKDTPKVASTSSASIVKKSKKKKKKVRITPSLSIIQAKQAAALRAAKKAKVTERLIDPRGRFTSLISVTNMINALLQGQLKQNMKAPALVNRTGRFASSVEVTQMSFTREGQVTAYYEYMKRPYQTFERGYRQGNEHRDPRRLIDKSIREVAAMYMHSKFDLVSRRL